MMFIFTGVMLLFGIPYIDRHSHSLQRAIVVTAKGISKCNKIKIISDETLCVK